MFGSKSGPFFFEDFIVKQAGVFDGLPVGLGFCLVNGVGGEGIDGVVEEGEMEFDDGIRASALLVQGDDDAEGVEKVEEEAWVGVDLRPGEVATGEALLEVLVGDGGVSFDGVDELVVHGGLFV